jgi:signal transduction histidine kinase/CheY-like chemotaxis protein/HAMP domain-containing protein
MAKVRGLSLFQKTGLLAFCLFGIISTMASSLAAWTLYSRMTEEYVSKGSAIAASIARGSQEILLARDVSTIQSMVDQYLDIEGVAYVFVVDADRLVVSHTFVPEMPKPLVELKQDKTSRVCELEVEQIGQVIDICKPVLAGVAGYVHVGMDKGVIMDYFWEAVIKMQTMLFVCFWVCVGILYLVTRHISRPLHQLTEHARRLEAHDFSATIDIRTNDEMEVLGRAMQSMGRELAVLFSEMESEVNKASGELRDHMAYLSSIIDNLVDGLLVVNPMGQISVINPAMREFFDLGDESVERVPVGDVFSDEVAGLATEVRQCARGVLSADIALSRDRTGKAVASPILAGDEAPKCLGGVILVRDITREKELDRLKTDFISTVSHELRTPMTSVLGFSKIIRKKLENSVFPSLAGSEEAARPIAQVRSNLDIIVSEAERLTDLINDVLDIARMEAGKVQWRDRRISMADVIAHSRNSTMGLWKNNGLALEVDIQENLPPVFGDFDRLVQVVVNLISNAVKFTETSPIVCRARAGNGMVVVSVEDKGAGIRSQDLSHVFDKFKQAGDTLTSKPAGTGLGLPICRQIVERHGGSIWVESKPGHGSTFTFSIPAVRGVKDADGGPWFECPEPETDIDVQLEQRETPLVLVVDDDPSLTNYLSQVFSDQGFRVKAADNGHDAVVRAQVLKPDLITMDIMMPGMDGNEAIGCLRSSPATRDIPILVLSALTDETERGDMALAKPVDEESLVRSAKALIGRRSVKTGCMLLGTPEKCDLDGLSVLCTGEMIFARVEDVWDHLDQGFLGVVFIPAEEVENIHLRRLIRVPGISVVILPVYSCQ